MSSDRTATSCGLGAGTAFGGITVTGLNTCDSVTVPCACIASGTVPSAAFCRPINAQGLPTSNPFTAALPSLTHAAAAASVKACLASTRAVRHTSMPYGIRWSRDVKRAVSDGLVLVSKFSRKCTSPFAGSTPATMRPRVYGRG